MTVPYWVEYSLNIVKCSSRRLQILVKAYFISWVILYYEQILFLHASRRPYGTVPYEIPFLAVAFNVESSKTFRSIQNMSISFWNI